MDKQAILTVENLKLSFGATQVLDGVDLTVNKGDVIAVIGPSGSGKSSFLRCLNCIEDPQSGSILFDGENLVDMKVDINKHRKKIGMVFQSFNLFSNKTVLENLTLAPLSFEIEEYNKIKLKNFFIAFANLFRKNKKEALTLKWKDKTAIKTAIKDQALKGLERIGLEDKKDFYPSSLSGGQKQRIAIIRALMLKPQILLFDEPTSALDPEMVGEVLDLIKEVAKEGMTMLIVTHEMGFAREIATRAVFIDEGKICEDCAPNEFFQNPKYPRLKEFLSKVL